MYTKKTSLEVNDIWIDHLIEIIGDKPYPPHYIGLMGGNAGLALLFNHLRQYKNDGSYDVLAHETLRNAAKVLRQNFEKKHVDPSFADGCAGTGWIFQFLNQDGNYDFELRLIDTYLLECVKNDTSSGNFDLLYGYLGSGLYFLNRNPENNSIAKEALLLILNSINAFSRRENDHIWWCAFDHKKDKVDYSSVNLGIAHGMPGIVLFLQKLFQLNQFRTDLSIQETLRKACNFLIDVKNPDNFTFSYPYRISVGRKSPENSRLAWCYGDLSIALTLAHVGKQLGDYRILNEAKKTFQKAAKILNIHDAGIVDNGICHGAAGVSLIFRAAYMLTGDKEFQAVSNYWKSICPADIFDFPPEEFKDTFIKYDLLSGWIGEALYLMTDETILPTWAEFFLIA